MKKCVLTLGLAVLVNAGLSGQIIVNATFDGTGDPLPAPWVLEAGTALKDDGSWAGKMGAFYPLSSLSPNTVYTITYDAFIPNTGATEFGGLALVTESGPDPVDSVDASGIAKAGWFMFRENGNVESRSFSTGTISKTGFYIPGGGSGSVDSLVSVVLTTGLTAADSTVSLSVDGVVFDMDNNTETPAFLGGVDLSGLTFIGLTGYADHVVDTFTIEVAAVPEAETMALLAGMAALGMVCWWRRRD